MWRTCCCFSKLFWQITWGFLFNDFMLTNLKKYFQLSPNSIQFHSIQSYHSGDKTFLYNLTQLSLHDRIFKTNTCLHIHLFYMHLEGIPIWKVTEGVWLVSLAWYQLHPFKLWNRGEYLRIVGNGGLIEGAISILLSISKLCWNQWKSPKGDLFEICPPPPWACAESNRLLLRWGYFQNVTPESKEDACIQGWNG